jgi:hypothetical protein
MILFFFLLLLLLLCWWWCELQTGSSRLVTFEYMWMSTVYAFLLNPKPMQTQEVGQVVAISLGVHVSCWGCSVFRNKDQQARGLIDGRGGGVGSSSSDTFSWIDL